MAQKKRQTIRVGDIFEVPLEDVDGHGYALLLYLYRHFKSVALLACGKDQQSLEQHGLDAAFSIQFVWTPSLRNGTWKLVGKTEVRQDFKPVVVSGFVEYVGDEKAGKVEKLGDLPLMGIGGYGFLVEHLATMIYGQPQGVMDKRAVKNLELLREQYAA